MAAEDAPDDEGSDEEFSGQGVEIEVTPAGKATRRLSLLSGGEKSLVALAFVFSVFLARPSPFYILDEVEAALDDANIDRFLQLIQRFADRAQFIIVTHQKRTMDAAEVLYGVSMGGGGVTKVISRRMPQRRRGPPGRARPRGERRGRGRLARPSPSRSASRMPPVAKIAAKSASSATPHTVRDLDLVTEAHQRDRRQGGEGHGDVAPSRIRLRSFSQRIGEQ